MNNMPMDLMMNGPIPGENFTSDTRNYPWHRPPEYTNPDDALDWISKMLSRKEGGFFVLTMLGFGLTVREIVSTILMKGFSQGKWTMDLALLIAGPLSHMIAMIAKREDMEYDLGINNNLIIPSDSFFSEVKKLKNTKPTDLMDEEQPSESNPDKMNTGFLSAPKEDIKTDEEVM